MSQLTQDLQDAIQKSLPQQVAGELSTFIAKANSDATLLKVVQDKNIALEQLVKNHADIINDLRKWEKLDAFLMEKEEALNAREIAINHKEELNKLTVQCAQNKEQNMMDVLRVVFKSQPVGFAFNRQVSEHAQEPQVSGNYGGTVPTNKNTTEMITHREITE